jgi:nucleoside 2-deoxyribosyltransferase
MARPLCFIIMPFLPRLHYFYLYLKNHVERIHNIDCERADDQVGTAPFLEKINDYIKRSDVIIADCSERNANVFYELGIAHAHEKKVILITGDKVEEAPADIRHFEFIHYEPGDHVKFFERLDNALRNVFETRYVKYFELAQQILKDFNAETQSQVKMPAKEGFVKKLSDAEQARGGLPPPEDYLAVCQLVLPFIIADSIDIGVMEKVTNWIKEKSKAQAPAPQPAQERRRGVETMP